VEYCDNLVFHKRAALDAMGERPFDANSTIGQPNKISTIFDRVSLRSTACLMAVNSMSSLTLSFVSERKANPNPRNDFGMSPLW
jgi:hypothetical protein